MTRVGSADEEGKELGSPLVSIIVNTTTAAPVSHYCDSLPVDRSRRA